MDPSASMALSRPPASAAGPLRAAKGRIISSPSVIETVGQEFARGKARMDVLALHGTPLFGCAPHVRARGNQTSLARDIGRFEPRYRSIQLARER